MLRFAAAFGLVNLVNDKRVTRWAITRIINQRLDSVRFRTMKCGGTVGDRPHEALGGGAPTGRGP